MSYWIIKSPFDQYELATLNRSEQFAWIDWYRNEFISPEVPLTWNDITEEVTQAKSLGYRAVEIEIREVGE